MVCALWCTCVFWSVICACLNVKIIQTKHTKNNYCRQANSTAIQSNIKKLDICVHFCVCPSSMLQLFTYSTKHSPISHTLCSLLHLFFWFLFNWNMCYIFIFIANLLPLLLLRPNIFMTWIGIDISAGIFFLYWCDFCFFFF